MFIYPWALAWKPLGMLAIAELAIFVGFLGAFTTFSTFEFETHALFEDGVWLTALTNMFASLFLGLLAVRAGLVLAKSWFVQ